MKEELEVKNEDGAKCGKSDQERLVMYRYIYHYCAEYRKGGSKVIIDGIAQMENRITCQEDYRRLKALIDPDVWTELAITSLSFIGTEGDPAKTPADT